MIEAGAQPRLAAQFVSGYIRTFSPAARVAGTRTRGCASIFPACGWVESIDQRPCRQRDLVRVASP